MKKFLLLFLAFVSCFNASLKLNEDIIGINLNEEMDRKEYLINPNQTYKFINSNNSYIFLRNSK